MSNGPVIAIVGATSLVGEAALEILAERTVPCAALHLLGEEADVGRKLEFRGSYHKVELIEGFAFGKGQLVLFLGPRRVSLEHAERAVAAGARVIDASGAFAGRADVPVIVPEVNAAAAQGAALVATPSAIATLLACALAPLASAHGLSRVSVATYQAVSEDGKAAVEELGRQTADLLNMRERKAKVYPKQIAFNVLPQIGTPDTDGYTDAEARAARELRYVLGREALPVAVTAVRVPVFYGHTLVVSADTEQPVSAAEAREIFRRGAGLRVLDEPQSDGFPTPVTEAAHEDAVFIGRIRADAALPQGLNFCIVADNVRKGAALNVIQIAELLLREL